MPKKKKERNYAKPFSKLSFSISKFLDLKVFCTDKTCILFTVGIMICVSHSLLLKHGLPPLGIQSWTNGGLGYLTIKLLGTLQNSYHLFMIDLVLRENLSFIIPIESWETVGEDLSSAFKYNSTINQ